MNCADKTEKSHWTSTKWAVFDIWAFWSPVLRELKQQEAYVWSVVVPGLWLQWSAVDIRVWNWYRTCEYEKCNSSRFCCIFILSERAEQNHFLGLRKVLFCSASKYPALSKSWWTKNVFPLGSFLITHFYLHPDRLDYLKCLALCFKSISCLDLGSSKMPLQF